MKELSWRDAKQRPLIIAHRGARLEAPENSLPAFERAYELDADGIEFDVRLTADGIPVVIHDAKLDRTTDGSGSISQKTYKEIRRLRLISSHDFDSEQLFIPTLAEVLENWHGKMLLNIELKQRNFSADLVSALAQLGQDRSHASTVVSSFNPAVLWHLHRILPDAQLAFLFVRPQRLFARLICNVIPCTAVHPHHGMISESLVKHAHQKKQLVHAWTVNTSERMSELAQLGANAIITDDPKLGRAALLADNA